jgi:hypothetical protein
MRLAAVFGIGCAAGAGAVILFTRTSILSRSHLTTFAQERSLGVQPSNLLILPRASQGFGGEWNGLLKQVLPPEPNGSKSKWVDVPEEREVGLRFDLRDGEVAARTSIWGAEDLRIIESSGQVLAPNHIKFSIESLYAAQPGNQPIWMVQEIDATLGGGAIQCAETILYYRTPGADPYETKVFVGTLRPISQAESQAMRELNEKQGLTRHGTVEAK